ncbi:hypothetical protein SANA_25380 [Gottschalkiaceae bacterium SANA]|nr:hypothetical protein SANA_25380 [Gottschalkiaceae bacterium SANA]
MVIETKEMNKFRKQNNIRMFISTSFSLPTYLRICQGHYFYEVSANIFHYLSHRNRKVMVSIKDDWVKDQLISVRHSTVSVNISANPPIFEFLNSSLIINVEVFADEYSEIDKSFIEHGRDFATDFIQANLEYFFFKYNISTCGEHAVIPTYYDCSTINTVVYYDIFGQIQNGRMYISPNVDGYQKIPDNNVFIEELKDQNFNVGRYFYSESKYAHKIGDHFKSIVYSAIVIETLVTDIIESNVLDPDVYVKKKNGNYYGMYKKLNKLISNGYIHPNVERTVFVDAITELLDNRHDIMHGNLNGLLNMSEVADINIRKLDLVYSDLLEGIT